MISVYLHLRVNKSCLILTSLCILLEVDPIFDWKISKRQQRFDRKISKLKILWKPGHLHLGCSWGKLKHIKNYFSNWTIPLSSNSMTAFWPSTHHPAQLWIVSGFFPTGHLDPPLSLLFQVLHLPPVLAAEHMKQGFVTQHDPGWHMKHKGCAYCTWIQLSPSKLTRYLVCSVTMFLIWKIRNSFSSLKKQKWESIYATVEQPEYDLLVVFNNGC